LPRNNEIRGVKIKSKLIIIKTRIMLNPEIGPIKSAPENEPETLGLRVEKRAIEFFEDAFDSAEEVWQTEKKGEEDKKGVDAGIRYNGFLIAPDITTGDEKTVMSKIKGMARNPFTYIKTPDSDIEEEAIRLVIQLNPEDWQEYCNDSDRQGTRVSESIPHDLLVREKQKVVNQMLGQIKIFEPNYKTDQRRSRVFSSIRQALEEEWK
jgi:hypothetical protein